MPPKVLAAEAAAAAEQAQGLVPEVVVRAACREAVAQAREALVPAEVGRVQQVKGEPFGMPAAARVLAVV